MCQDHMIKCHVCYCMQDYYETCCNCFIKRLVTNIKLITSKALFTINQAVLCDLTLIIRTKELISPLYAALYQVNIDSQFFS